MIVLLLGVLVLVIGGCVCVVWAERGGPRWARIVAALTRGAGELLSSAQKSRSRNRSGDTDDD
ncbi:putative membrane protein [Streptomyces hygroscopicus subsp. jinggangensis 5008]|nr:putative membrane protein [Streptomyces hygroscopicus subsp. jinggangensis 5008]AGF66156.1 putative membrane protein [Streptomyces hygroscopicus subsp. jinggangensis TL01]